MRKLFLMAVTMVMLLAACTAPSPQPTASTGTTTATSPTPTSSASATTEPSQPPSTVPGEDPTESSGSAGDDEPGRYAFRCTSLDASPEVQLSSLAEVWAANNYMRMASCEVSYEGDAPFEATAAEAQAISTAAPQGVTADNGLAVMLDVLRLCTRISDETGPGGFAEASHDTLVAAASFCPDAPQGKIIAAWADGTRTPPAP